METFRKYQGMLGALAVALALGLTACSAATSTPTSLPRGANNTPTGVPSFISPGGNELDGSQLRQFLQPISGSQQYGISVSGLGKVMAKPDLGSLSFSVEARGDTVADAREKAARVMTVALDALRGNGIAEKNIQTQHFAIHPITVYPKVRNTEPSVPTIVGYRVTNSAVAKVRELDRFGDVIDAVAKAAGNEIRITSINFAIEDPRPLEVQARQLALEDALARGKQISQVMNITMGPPLFISESGGPTANKVAYARSSASEAGVDFAQTPITAGESEIVIAVQVVFGIR